MSIEVMTLLFFGSLLFFLLLGLPLAFVLGGVSVVFLYFTWALTPSTWWFPRSGAPWKALHWWPYHCLYSWQ